MHDSPYLLPAAASLPGPDELAAMRRAVAEDPDAFWSAQARDLLDWASPFERAYGGQLDPPRQRWFAGGALNAAHNCLDRHLTSGRRNKAALIWQGEPENQVRVLTYQMLHTEVCRFAAVLKNLGVRPGDRVGLLLPMIPELAVAMLACARIGAVHVVLYAGLGAPEAARRLADCQARVLVTADGTLRAGRWLDIKAAADEAMASAPPSAPGVESCVVVRRGGLDVPLPAMTDGRDRWWHELMDEMEPGRPCPPEPMDALAPLFILYTEGPRGGSGRDGMRGVVHATGPYLTWAAYTSRLVFGLGDEDVHWCTADAGWITGHTYLIYGPLACGTTSLMYEGAPTWPLPDRYWRIVDAFKVSVLYTAPTDIRALMREGPRWAARQDLASLRLLASVGETLAPEAWRWFAEAIGRGRAPLLDTWWQTETGGICLAPLPGDFAEEAGQEPAPGSVGRPLPGVEAEIRAADGSVAPDGEEGHLALTRPWPGMYVGVWGLQSGQAGYPAGDFTRFPGAYATGDAAVRDAQGRFWVTGRLDDAIPVSGRGQGPAVLEGVLAAHPAVAETAVVSAEASDTDSAEAASEGGLCAFVVLRQGFDESAELAAELEARMRERLAGGGESQRLAQHLEVRFADELPKTRSGKISRKTLRKVASGKAEAAAEDALGLADPGVIDDLLAGRF